MMQSPFTVSLINPNQTPELINNTHFKQSMADYVNSKQRHSVATNNNGLGYAESNLVDSMDQNDDNRKLTAEQLDKELDEYAQERRRLVAVKRGQEAEERRTLTQVLEAALAAEEESLEREMDIFRHDGHRAMQTFFYTGNGVFQANDAQAMMM